MQRGMAYKLFKCFVHDDPTGRFVFVANPARLEFGTALDQFRVIDGSGGTTVVPLAGPPTPRPVEDLPEILLGFSHPFAL